MENMVSHHEYGINRGCESACAHFNLMELHGGLGRSSTSWRFRKHHFKFGHAKVVFPHPPFIAQILGSEIVSSMIIVHGPR